MAVKVATPWSEFEITLLRRQLLFAMPIECIARRLTRDENDVRDKAWQLAAENIATQF